MRNLAVQDLVVVVFHSYMLLRVSLAPDSPDALCARRGALVLLSVTVCAILIARGELMPGGAARSLLYRLGVVPPLPISYILMKHLLPALQPHLLDLPLMRIDEMFLGVTPAVWLQRFVTPRTVEWFSFFYYSYFPIALINIAGSVLFDRGRRQREFAFAAMSIGAVGHTLYTLVPGMGPFATIHFPPLVGGFWWRMVEQTVSSEGAVLDIFPSLHTAFPAFWALHAFRHRRGLPYRYVWPVLTFFALNTIIATLFLRWHWAVDVVAGLALAVGVQVSGIVVSRYEERRASPDRQPVWEPWF